MVDPRSDLDEDNRHRPGEHFSIIGRIEISYAARAGL